MNEIRMPTRWHTLKRTAGRLMLGRDDFDTLAGAMLGLGLFIGGLAHVLLRLVLFLTLPVSALLLYPLMRANHRRWYETFSGTEGGE